MQQVRFTANQARSGGGIASANSTAELRDVIFQGNTATSSGGGLFNETSTLTITNTLFSTNHANHGGGVYNTGSGCVLTNATMSGNTATSNGGGMRNYNASHATVQNSILWGNTAAGGTVGVQQLANSGSTATVASSLIGGSGGSGAWEPSLGTDGGHNRDADPLFVNPPDAGADGIWGTADDDSGDLRLRATSPALDVGDNAALPAWVTTDLHGYPRVLNDVVDMGGMEALHTNPVYMPLVQQLPHPPHTISYYMATRDRATITNMGCEQGEAHRDEPGMQNGVVILMFGEPAWDDTSGTRVYGAYDYTDNFISPEQIRNEALWFAEGYIRCKGDDTSVLTLAIGTSNDGTEFTQEPEEFGRQWGRMLDDLQDDFDTETMVIDDADVRYSDHVIAQGASDMELDWGTPADTRAWVVAYILESSRGLYNYGDAAGCPLSSIGDNGCMHNWTQEDVWYISIHGGAIPQIYTEAGPGVRTQGEQWYYISLDAVEDNPRRHPIDFLGSLTQHGDCQQDGPQACPGTRNTPEEGWRQLWDNLRRDARTRQAIPWSTDIQDSP